MIESFIINIALLITFIFFWHQMFTKRRLTFESPLWVKFADGILGGILGIILMHFSIYVNEITLLDLRHIPVIIVAYYGGMLPPIIAAIVISIGRYFIDINISSHFSLIMMLVIALGSGLISIFIKLVNWKKWLLLLFYAQAVFSIALYLVSPNYIDVLDAAILHIICSICGGFIAFYFVRYIRKNSELLMKYKEYSRKDPLTGLYNIRTFHHYYKNFIKLARNENIPFTLMMLDIDHFKKVNDTYGHIAGDEVLKQIGNLLLKITGKDAIVTRNGGEEFAILLYGQDINSGRALAENIRKEIENTSFHVPNHKDVKITISIGLAQYDPKMEHEHILYQESDQALYQAKSTRNIVEIRHSDLLV